MKEIRKLTLEDVPEHIKPALSVAEWKHAILWGEGCQITPELVECSKRLDYYWDQGWYEDVIETMAEISTYLSKLKEFNEQMELLARDIDN